MMKMTFPTYGYNTRILIDADLDIVELQPNEHFQDESRFIAEFRAPGYWNEDTTVYTEGWTEETEDGKYKTDDGRILELEEVIAEAIREGEWAQEFNEMWNEIYRQSMGEKVS